MSVFANATARTNANAKANVNANAITSPLTCVSGFWSIKNKHGNKFLDWFKNTLKINCPYVFFSTKEGIELIKTYRLNLPTYYIECNIADFYTYKYKANMLTHPIHCPSVELNLIWHEKMCLMEKAQQLNPFQSDFFCWVDAGVCVYRDRAPPPHPFPNLAKLNTLPQDKFIYAVSNPWNASAVANMSYYHHISGTAYLLHRNIIPRFAAMYKHYLERIFTNNNINKRTLWTDQVILTHMFNAFPHKFYKLCEGYGTPVLALQ